MIISSPIITHKDAIKRSTFSESGIISRYDDIILIKELTNNIVLSLGATFFNKYLVIKMLYEGSFKARVAGSGGNFEEDDILTLLAQTVSSPASGNTLTASGDVSGDLVVGDTIKINGVDQFTVGNIASNIITTVETITNAYSADIMEVSGIIIGQDPQKQAIILFSDNVDKIWRSIA